MGPLKGPLNPSLTEALIDEDQRQTTLGSLFGGSVGDSLARIPRPDIRLQRDCPDGLCRSNRCDYWMARPRNRKKA